MSIINVTGGTAFKEVNYIHFHLKAQSEDRMVWHDKLSYAVNFVSTGSGYYFVPNEGYYIS